MEHNHRSAAIDITGLAKTYRTGGATIRAVDDITLQLEAGTMTAITGASGSGKSVLHVLGAIERADTGIVRVDDVELTSLSRTKLTGYRRAWASCSSATTCCPR